MPNSSRIKQSILAVAVLGALTASTLAPAADSAKLPSNVMDKVEPQPAQELSGQVVYQMMLAEIAAARNEYVIAAQAYLDLARRTRDARIARRATEVALVGQQLDAAGEAARIWVAVEPDSSNALQTFAAVLAGGYGKLEDLEPPLKGLLARETVPTEAVLLQLPRLYARYPDKAAAAASVERLTAPYLDLAEAHFARAVVFLAAQDLTRAETAANRALSLRSDWEAAALIRVQAVPKERQAQAMEALNQFTKRNPLAREARLTYARWLLEEKRVTEAGEVYRKLAGDFPNDDDVAYSVAALSVQADDYPTAEKLLRRLISHKYRDVDLLHLQLGQLLEENERASEAVPEYEAVGPGQHQVAARARIAQVMIKRGQIDAARAYLHNAAADNPNDMSAYMLTESQLLRQLGDLAPAQAVLKDLLVKQPDNEDALYESAMLSERMRQYEPMEQDLRRLIKLKPDFAQAYNALGYSLVERNIRLSDAETLLNQAIKLAPDDAAILDSVGWLRYRKGDLPGALDHLQRAYSKMPDPEVAAHLGEVLWILGRKDDARRTWEESRKSNPENSVLAEVMKRFTQ